MFIPAHDDRLVLAERCHRLLVEIKVRLHEFGRRQRHPLVERHIGKARALNSSRKRNVSFPVFSM